MTIRSLVLFAHVVGVLTLFMALAIDWFSLRFSSRIGAAAALPRAYGGASALILLSGIYLARLTGTFELPFVWLSLILLVLMGILGGPIRTRMPASWLRAGVLLRGAIGLAAVYLMVGKPPLTASLIIIAGAIAVGLVTGLIAQGQEVGSLEKGSA